MSHRKEIRFYIYRVYLTHLNHTQLKIYQKALCIKPLKIQVDEKVPYFLNGTVLQDSKGVEEKENVKMTVSPIRKKKRWRLWAEHSTPAENIPYLALSQIPTDTLERSASGTSLGLSEIKIRSTSLEPLSLLQPLFHDTTWNDKTHL